MKARLVIGRPSGPGRHGTIELWREEAWDISGALLLTPQEWSELIRALEQGGVEVEVNGQPITTPASA